MSNSKNNTHQPPDRIYPYSPVINAIVTISNMLGSRQMMKECALKERLQHADYLLTDELYEEAMQICNNTGIISQRTEDGWCYQINTRKITREEWSELQERLKNRHTNQIKSETTSGL